MDKRVSFLKYIIGENETGHIVLGARNKEAGTFYEFFFNYPKELDTIEEFILDHQNTSDIYFCPTILSEEQRIKKNIKTSNVIYADLDKCHPDLLKLRPTIILETSPDNYQGFWKLAKTEHALDVEQINKNIAYRHADDGCDKSGWDLTQYLRVPNTRNFKYKNNPTVKIIEFDAERIYSLDDFNEVYKVTEQTNIDIPDFPVVLPKENGEELLDKYSNSINNNIWQLFTEIPDDDWSSKLWNLQLTLFEIGVSLPEVYVIARDSAVNKYARDGRPEIFLWKETVRAHQSYKNKTYLIEETEQDTSSNWHLADAEILTKEELDKAVAYDTFIDTYISWGRSISDATANYHIAGALTILSSIMCDKLKIPTAYGNITPNLWFMLIADTTLTRKSTAMDMAMDLIYEEDKDILLATDGSIEGMMQSMANRPNRPSVFLRDEFTGLIEQMRKKDYMAGMMETLTKLYDAKPLRRLLKKETIDIKAPLLIIYAGGIRSKLLEQITYDHINSGFIPRFCFIIGKSNPENVRPLGPPTRASLENRVDLIKHIEHLNLYYNPNSKLAILPENEYDINAKYHEVQLSDDAWTLYNRIDSTMTNIGINSSLSDLMTPMMARLSQSGLKIAALIAASTKLTVPVIIDEIDIIKAFYYIRVFKDAAIEIVANADKTASEQLLERIYREVLKHEEGVSRASIMSRFRINAREAKNVFETLTQRGHLKSHMEGGSLFYTAVKYRDNKKVAL